MKKILILLMLLAAACGVEEKDDPLFDGSPLWALLLPHPPCAFPPDYAAGDVLTAQSGPICYINKAQDRSFTCWVLCPRHEAFIGFGEFLMVAPDADGTAPEGTGE